MTSGASTNLTSGTLMNNQPRCSCVHRAIYDIIACTHTNERNDPMMTRPKNQMQPTPESKVILNHAYAGFNQIADDDDGNGRLHAFVVDAVRGLFDLAAQSGGAYISNDGIDEHWNEIMAVVQYPDFTEEYYACQYPNDVCKDMESPDYRSFASDVDRAGATHKHLRELDMQILMLCASIKELYFDGENNHAYVLPDDADGIDLVSAIVGKINARLYNTAGDIESRG